MKKVLLFRAITLVMVSCMILTFVLAAAPLDGDPTLDGDIVTNEDGNPAEPGDGEEPGDDSGDLVQALEPLGDIMMSSSDPDTWDNTGAPTGIVTDTEINVLQNASGKLEITGTITVTLNFSYTGRFNGFIDITDNANVIFNIEEGRTITTRGQITSAGMGKLTVIGGGTLAIANVFYYDGTGGIELMGTSRLNVVSGGDLNVTGLIKSHGGNITISGGTATIGGNIESDGNVNISGGTVTITGSITCSLQGIVNITGGKVEIESSSSAAAITANSIHINGGSGSLKGGGTNAVVATSTSTLSVNPRVIVRELGTPTLAEIETSGTNMFFVRAGTVDPLDAVEFETRPAPAPRPTATTTAVSPKMGDIGTGLGVLPVLIALGTGGAAVSILVLNSRRKK
jgi:hypothetical protein